MMEIIQDKADDNFNSPSSSSLVVAVAIKGNKKSNVLLRWALNNFVAQEIVVFKLIHVHDVIKGVPTPVGNVPLFKVRDDVAAAFKKEIEWKTSQMLLPYKKMCENRRVQVDVVVIESDDVATAIAEEVAKNAITKLVIGASSPGIFTSKLKCMSAKISVCTPRFCTVYAVSQGKLSSLQPSDTQTDGCIIDDSSETICSTNSLSTYTSTSQTDSVSVTSYAPSHSPSLAAQRFQALSTINHTLLSTNPSFIKSNHSRCQLLDLERELNPASAFARYLDVDYTYSWASSCKSALPNTEYWIYDQNSIIEVQPANALPSPHTEATFNLELEKLRIELRNDQAMHTKAESENINASREFNNLNKRSEKPMKLKENIVKEMDKELATNESKKYKGATKEVSYLNEYTKTGAAERREALMKAVHSANEKEKFVDALTGSISQYRKFKWEEIVSATSSFSEELKIGMGTYGTVYKCSLDRTTMAVKVFHSKGSHHSKQFQQELEILSRIRHPNLLRLLGACPDHGCLVCEYMENGSLEDRLLRKDNTASIPWFDRYRIAWEVASALSFLHKSRPKPIIHRDLKPANILLDRNLVSKIGDTGLSTVLQTDTTMYKDTGPVGTLCYIDPEYQRTGLISPKSDVYAFGMVILQLLTAKPAVALTHVVETAIDNGNLTDILDPEAGKWPFQETLELARLGVSCAELRRRDRPDLEDHVLPTLDKLKEIADRARDSASSDMSRPPNHFICPLLQDVMDDPCVAADGYTYDRKAIEIWFQENDKSPITNMALPHKNLIPSYTLLSAIMEWKSRES